MAVLSEQIVKPPTVDFLELLAARRAVSFSTQLDYVQGVCEGNSESVVNALKGSGMKNSRGNISSRIFYLIQTLLRVYLSLL